jgi:hypothetical protein
MVVLSKLGFLAATASPNRDLFQVPMNPGFLSQQAAAQPATYAYDASYGYAPYSDMPASYSPPQTYAEPVYASPNGFEYVAYEQPAQGWGWPAVLGFVAAGALAGRAIGEHFSSPGAVESEVATLAVNGQQITVPSRAGTPEMFGGSSKSAPKRAAPKRAAVKNPNAVVGGKKAPVKRSTTPVRKAAPVKKVEKNVNRAFLPKDQDKLFCYGLPGNIAPLGDFDPLNLLKGRTKEEVLRSREVELTHGRVSMLAALGFFVQEQFHPLFGGSLDGPAINQIPEIPVPFFVLLTVAIGIAEVSRLQAGWANPYESKDNFQKLRPDYMPGDLKFDPLGIRPTDPAALRSMQERELSHGRLAMIASIIFIGQEVQSQQPWLDLYGGVEDGGYRTLAAGFAPVVIGLLLAGFSTDSKQPSAARR